MDVNVPLTDQESAALAALADARQVTVAELLRERLDAPLKLDVQQYLDSRGTLNDLGPASPATARPGANVHGIGPDTDPNPRDDSSEPTR